MSLTEKSPLCPSCRDIFDGHFAPFDRAMEEYSSLFLNLRDWYGTTKQPNWYIRVSGSHSQTRTDPASSSGPFESVFHFHHTLPGLPESSKNCVLCALLFERTQANPPILPEDIDDDDLFGIPVIAPNDGPIRVPFDLVFLYVLREREPNGLSIVAGYSTNLHVIDMSLPENKNVWRLGWSQEGTYSRIRQWLETIHHPVELSSALPTRLIHIESKSEEAYEDSGSPRRVRLVETSEAGLDVETTRYAALSHVWGGKQPLRLLQDSLGQFLDDGIPLDSMPKTFQDAMALASALGIAYIWIDSLCIIQDSREDWQREAARMTSVYSRAHVTISATAADDSSTGLGSDSMLKHACVAYPTWTGFDDGDTDTDTDREGRRKRRSRDGLECVRIIDRQDFARKVLGRPLFKRGWIFQEWILSPKTIHCARDQLWWSSVVGGSEATYACNETCDGYEFLSTMSLSRSMSLREIYALADHDQDHYRGATPLKVWSNLLQDYMTRRFTFESDRLVAFSGIASIYSRLVGVPEDSYLAGHWRDSLTNELLWTMADGRRVVPPQPYRAPSWSWASMEPIAGEPDSVGFGIGWTGGILESDTVGVEKMATHKTLEVRDAQVSTVGSSRFGPATGGFVVLESPLIKASLRVDVLVETTLPQKYWAEFFPGGDPRITQEHLTVGSSFPEATVKQSISGIQMDDVFPSFSSQGPVDVYLALFRYQVDPAKARTLGYALILRKSFEKGEYHRIGFVNLTEDVVGLWTPTGRFDVFAELDEDDFLCRGEGAGFYSYRVV